ncbi:amidase (plasmid) [Sinorhizobium meliloti]|uniref:amidase n=1 Tax=Rhizobium meliloti TaxID=382 RepID=UPI0004894575|nr:amidase [Sinorhizobium meliloti]MCO6423161.1 amidase [Sinorhizobium meliloti]MDE3831283.1 amidase [Sinorhizobium meliloti]MDE3877076.1 amidase [Sinorhizobium meliloti]MDE4578964.1 amidase [Sinorhizobium meliloti]MDW9623787.1 amidase [Sinorhizobium meliloti]
MAGDATSLGQAIQMGRLTASEAMEASLAAACQLAETGAIVHVDPTLGRTAAENADARLRHLPGGGRIPPFLGVPSLAKDLGGPFAGLPVAAGSNMLERRAAVAEDSDLAERLRGTGLCFFGLTTVPEMGLSLASEPAAGPICRNPLDAGRTPGGSSGGAAAAVAAGIVAIAHATDAGGSMRVPAACCGLFGLKASRGAIAAGPSFGNHLGGIASELALCRSVRDLAVIFNAAAGRARGPFADPWFAPSPPGPLRVGLLVETGDQYPTEPARSEAVEEAARALEADGHSVVPMYWDAFAASVATSGRALRDIIAVNLANFVVSAGLDAGRSERLTQAFINHGSQLQATALWATLGDAVHASHAVWSLFDRVDCILTPMLASAPLPIGSFPFDHDDIDLQIRRMTAFAPLATLANATGFPALTLPFGADDAGLPLPVQILAPMGGDRLLIELAARLEREGRWQHRFAVAGIPE